MSAVLMQDGQPVGVTTCMATPPAGTTNPVPTLGPPEEPQGENPKLLPYSEEKRTNFVVTAVLTKFVRFSSE